VYRQRGGFSAVELLIALTLGIILVGGVYGVLFSQWRLFSLHRATTDARQSLRTATALLSWELAAASPAVGDIHAIGPNSLTFRSLQGSGVVCSRVKVGSRMHYGLQQSWGYFEGTADDSALAYRPKRARWSAVNVAKAWNKAQSWADAPSGGGTPVCFWGDSTAAMPRPQASLQLQASDEVLDEIVVGAPVRVFRRTQYELFQQDGYWWLGRRIGNSKAHQIVTGPLLSPEAGGFVLKYYDSGGAVTADPARVARVDIALRATSLGAAGYVQRTRQDSLHTTVFIRG
jgi:hypothetical protein